MQMQVRNPIYDLMNTNQFKFNNNPMNNNMPNFNPIKEANNPNFFNINKNIYNPSMNNMNNNIDNNIYNNNMNNNNPNSNQLNNNCMNNFSNFMNMNNMNNMNMPFNNMMLNSGFNNMPLNNNLIPNNNMNNNMMMNSTFFNNMMPFFNNNFYPNMNLMKFPQPFPIMNNMLNVNRFNFFGVNGNNNGNNNNSNNNSNNNENNGNNNIQLPDLDEDVYLNEYLFAPGNNADFNKLKKQFIKELDTYQYKNKDKFENALIEDDCSICLCKYKITDMLTTLPCKHGFHKKCIKKWLSNDEHNKCPLCNLDIKAEINKRKANLEKHIHDDEHEDD